MSFFKGIFDSFYHDVAGSEKAPLNMEARTQAQYMRIAAEERDNAYQKVTQTLDQIRESIAHYNQTVEGLTTAYKRLPPHKVREQQKIKKELARVLAILKTMEQNEDKLEQKRMQLEVVHHQETTHAAIKTVVNAANMSLKSTLNEDDVDDAQEEDDEMSKRLKELMDNPASDYFTEETEMDAVDELLNEKISGIDNVWKLPTVASDPYTYEPKPHFVHRNPVRENAEYNDSDLGI
jgi:chromosome segregation ATPase